MKDKHLYIVAALLFLCLTFALSAKAETTTEPVTDPPVVQEENLDGQHDPVQEEPAQTETAAETESPSEATEAHAYIIALLSAILAVLIIQSFFIGFRGGR